MSNRLQTVTSLKSHTQSVNRLFEVILLTLMGVLMYASQVVMASLPNIEIVSLLIILVARKFGIKSLISVYIFVLCEIFTYEFSLWIVNYLYIWAIFAFVITIIRKIDSTAVYTLISGIFGLTFGTLCSIPYFLTGGISFGVTYIINGFWFDLLHCGGNITLTFVLYRPLTKAFNKAVNRFK